MPAASQAAIWVCWLVFGLVWVAAAFSTKRALTRGVGARWYPIRGWVLPLVLAAAVLAARGLGGHLWAPSPVVGALLAAIVAMGLVFTLWARAALGGNWSAGVVLKEGHTLVRSGPYAIVRHPIYTGLLAMTLGTGLYAGSMFGLVLVGAVAVVLCVRSFREDELMAATFPDEYPGYRRRVRAFIPYVL